MVTMRKEGRKTLGRLMLAAVAVVIDSGPAAAQSDPPYHVVFPQGFVGMGPENALLVVMVDSEATVRITFPAGICGTIAGWCPGAVVTGACEAVVAPAIP